MDVEATARVVIEVLALASGLVAGTRKAVKEIVAAVRMQIRETVRDVMEENRVVERIARLEMEMSSSRRSPPGASSPPAQDGTH